MFYLINKPIGVSSFFAIKRFARQNNIKKIGHSGTLDPLASGALLVATNDDTKLLSYVSETTKTYIATFKIGYVSNTFDSTGDIKKTSDKKIGLATVQKVLTQFLGKIRQIPPQFSAKKISGVRAYALARKGVKVRLKPILVEIFAISDLKQLQENVFSFKVKVSAGTYIRSLINDIGQKLGTGALMMALHRAQIGNQKLAKTPKVIDPLAIIDLPLLKLGNLEKIKDGQAITSASKDGLYLLIFKKQIIGTGQVQAKLLKPNKLLSERIKQIISS